MTAAASLRAVSNALRIPHFCDRASCRRIGKCRGDAERCLGEFSASVPLAAREFVIDLLNARELGYSFEEALRRDREGVRAFAAWSASAVQGRSK